MEKAIMQFHCCGIVSEENHKIIKKDGDIITLDTDEDLDKCYRFNLKTGKCLNDNTALGAKRTLKLKTDEINN